MKEKRKEIDWGVEVSALYSVSSLRRISSVHLILKAWHGRLVCCVWKHLGALIPSRSHRCPAACFHSNNEHEPWRYQSRNNWKPSAHERFTRECATSCTECIKYFYFAWVQSVVWSFCDAVGGPRLVQWHVILREKRRKMSRSMPVSVGALFFSGGWEENYLNWVVYGGLGTGLSWVMYI